MTNVTVIGRLTADPELRFTASGTAVTNFTIAEQHRRKVDGEWQDDGATFWRVDAWSPRSKEGFAEHCAERLGKGDTVIVVGDARNREYETRDGGKGRSLEIRAEHVGLTLRWAPRTSREKGERVPDGDPWAAPQGGPKYTDEPPF